MPPTKDQIQEFPLTFEGGLVTEVEDSTLEVGQAASLVNWVPTAQGGLRARNAWDAISTLGLTADYKVRGWGTAAISSGGGLATPSIVQVDAWPNTSSDTATVSSKAVSLSGVTPGNLLVIAVTHEPSNGGPDDLAGWTRATGGTAINPPTFYYKVATGTTVNETITTTASVANIHGTALLEIAGVETTHESVDTEDASSPFTNPITLSVTSTALSGIALMAWNYSNDAFGLAFQNNSQWNQEPNTGATWTLRNESRNNASLSASAVFSKVYSTSPTSETAQTDSDLDELYGAAISFDANPAASSPADFYIFIAVATSTGYSIYRIPRDQIQTGTWELVDSATCSDTSAFVSMAIGAGTLVWSASTMDVPRSVVLSTLTGANVTDLNGKSGRAVAYHKDRMFVAGSADNAPRVYFSGIGTPTTFATSTDFLDIGGDDGEAIEDLVSVEGLLLVCKVNRLYLVSGSGIESFFVNELSGGSAATGRPAVRTPYGTVVVGPTDIWVVQGGGVDPMSRPLGEGFSITGLVSTAYAQDAVMVADSSTGRVWRANLVTGSWSLEEVNDDEDIVGHLFSLQGRVYYGVAESSSNVGGTRRLSSARDYDFVGGTSFEASTGKLALLGPSVTYTPRHIFMQVRNQDTDHPNALHVTVRSDLGTEVWGDMIEAEVKRYRVDLGTHRNASWLQVILEADSSAIAGALDVEKIVMSTYVDGVR